MDSFLLHVCFIGSTTHFPSNLTSQSSNHREFNEDSIVSPFNRNYAESEVKETTLPNLSQDASLFQNNFMFHIIIGLVGVFVLFVIYSKFFSKRTSNFQGMNQKLQARYKSLNIEKTEQEPTLYSVGLDQQGPMLNE